MNLSVTGLNVYFEGNHVLKDINLEIHDGEFFCLLGASGCGKSTLLKTIAGLVQERDGEIICDGRKLHCLPPQKRGVVIMFQDRRLFNNMTVGENVAFSLRNKGVKKAQRAEAAKRFLELVQLPGFENRRVHELSGGQQQRVALARALAAEPSVLLLDEPFSALDENLRDQMRFLVKDIHMETGITTIMVTHDQNEALSISDRIAVMSSGEIIQVGTPLEVYTHPASLEIAEYFASVGELRGDVSSGVFTAGSISFSAPQLADGPAISIIRQNNLSLSADGVPFEVEAVLYRGQRNSVVLNYEQCSLCMEMPLDEHLAEGGQCPVKVDWGSTLLFSCDKISDNATDR